MQSTTVTFFPQNSPTIEDRLFTIAIEHGAMVDLNNIQRRAITAFRESKEFSLLTIEQKEEGFFMRISRRIHIQ